MTKQTSTNPRAQTATPSLLFLLDGDESRDDEDPILRVRIDDDENYDLASFATDETGESWKYGRLIVKRLNQHTKLVAALRAVVQAADTYRFKCKCPMTAPCTDCKQAGAALALTDAALADEP